MSNEVASFQKAAVDGMEMFLRNFSKVPDDRLNWAPVPTAKTPLRVAAHTALYAGRFAAMIRDRKLPQPENLDQWLAAREAEELAISSRDEMERVFRQGTQEALAAMDAVTAEDLELSLDSGMGWSMPLRSLLNLPGWHATLHLGQIDYLQTCWGDQEIYVG